MSEESDDELLLRNVNDLKKRLLQTEKSLHLLQTPKTKSTSSHDDRNLSSTTVHHRYRTPADHDFEPLQPLTLDDLDISDTSTEKSHRLSGTLPASRGYQSYTKLPHTSSRNSKLERRSDSPNRRKVQTLKDENADLRSGKHKLEHRLKDTEYELKAAKKQIQSLSVELDTGQNRPLVLHEKLVNLESEVATQDETLRHAEDRLEECQQKLAEKELQLKKSREDVRICKADLVCEIQCRKRMESQRDKALRNLEDLNDHLTEFRSKTKEKLQKSQDNEDHLKESLLQRTKESDDLIANTSVLEAELQDTRQHVRRLEEVSYTNSTLQATTHRLQSSLTKYHEDVYRLQREIDSKTTENKELQLAVADHQEQLNHLEQKLEFKSREVNTQQETLTLQKQELERIKDELGSKERENQELSELTEIQNERLAECQLDMERNRSELIRLEGLAGKLQGKLKSYNSDHLPATSIPSRQSGVGAPLHASSPHHTPSPARSTSSSAIQTNGSWNEGMVLSESDYGTGSNSSSSKAVIAELRMKLALKEAEIHKLEAARQSRPAGNYTDGSSVLNGLRSELTAIVQTNKLGDRKAQELEGIISRLEEEHYKQTYKLIEMQQHMSDEDSHSATLQSRVEHCSAQIRDLQKEISIKSRTVEDIEMLLEEKTNQVSMLEEQLEDKSTSLTELISNLASAKEELRCKTSTISRLETNLQDKTKDLDKSTDNLSQTKSIHVIQCKELQQQIELLQMENDKIMTRLRQVEESKKILKDEVEVRVEQVKDLEKVLQEKQQELDSNVADYAGQCRILQQKTEDGSSRVAHLEAALIVCKEELTMYIEQLEECKDKHDFDMECKQKEVAGLEIELQQVHHNLENKQKEICELQQALHQRQQMLQQSAGRMADLEDKESQLTEQVSHLERQLSQVKSMSEQDAEMMEKKLHQACVDLEERTSKLTEATNKQSEYKIKLGDTSSRLSATERQLNQATTNADNQVTKITQLESDLMQAKGQLENKTQKAKDVEDMLNKKTTELQEALSQISDQDIELTRAQRDLRAAASQLTDLQRLLQRSRVESMERHKRVQELTENLKRAQEDLHNREQEITEIDSALRASHSELDNRSSQVKQLDLAIKDRQARMEKQIHELENNLGQSQYELKLCSKQMGDLEDKCQHQQDLLKENNLQLTQTKQIEQKQMEQLRQKTNDIAELEQKIAKLKQQQTEHQSVELEQGQQMRLTREQMQRQQAELTEMRHKMVQIEKERNQLSTEIDDAMELVHNKDMEKAQLAEQLGQMRVQEADAEAQFSSELLHIRQTQERELAQKDREIVELQKSQADLITSVNQSKASSRLKIKRLQESVSTLQQEVAVLQERNIDVENDLKARKEVVEAANEAIVIKEAEVARLNARISGYERAAFGIHLTPSNKSKFRKQSNKTEEFSPAFSSYIASPHEASPKTLRRSNSDVNLARKEPRSEYFNYSIDTDNNFGRESFSQRESFDRIFKVPDFPLGMRLLPDTKSKHIMDTGCIHQSPTPNANNYHLEHHGTAGDLAQTNSPTHMYAFSPVAVRSCKQASRPVVNHNSIQIRRDSGDKLHQTRTSEEFQTNFNHQRQSKQSFFPDDFDETTQQVLQHDSSHISQGDVLQQQRTTKQSQTAFNKQGQSNQSLLGDDMSSLDGENLNTLQNMLSYVNSQIAAEEQLKQGGSISSLLELDSPSFAPLPDTPQKAIPSGTPVKLPIRQKPSVRMPSPNSNASSSTSSGRGKLLMTSSLTPQIMKLSPTSRTTQGDTSAFLQTTPLKQKLAKQKPKMAAANKKLKPLDCMADLHDKLRANDKRRMEVDQQLFGL